MDKENQFDTQNTEENALTGNQNEEFVDIETGNVVNRSQPEDASKTDIATVSSENIQEFVQHSDMRAEKEDLIKTRDFDDGYGDLILSAEDPSAQNRGHYATGKKKNSKNFFVRHKIPVLITSAAVFAAAVTGVILWQFFGGENGLFQPEPTVSIVNTNGEFVYMDGITISGVDISGKTFDEAKALLEENESRFLTPFTVEVQAKEKVFAFAETDFSYTYNIEDVLNKAKRYCQQVSEGDIKPTEATGSSGETVSTNMFTVEAKLDPESVKTVSERVAGETDVKPVQAKVTKFTPFADKEKRFEYAEGIDGYKMDQEALTESLTAFLESEKTSGTIKAKGSAVKPSITKEMVKKNIVPLSTFSTVSVNTADATHNMSVALEACNGSVVEPGETWSFNGCTGDSNLESNGYRSAGVISGGKLVQGVGGGLCQASSTIYNAAIFANMKIAERHNHLWASTYVPAGLDATIDYPGLDLKLENITDYQMFIECKLSGTTLVCNIYGYQDPSYDVIKTISENYDIVSGESYSNSAFRVYYKDGEEVKKEKLPSSYYSLSEGHYVQYADEGTYGKKPGESGSASGSSSGSPSASSSNRGNDYNDDPPVSSSSVPSSKPSSSSSQASSSSSSASSSSSSSKPDASSSSGPDTSSSSSESDPGIDAGPGEE